MAKKEQKPKPPTPKMVSTALLHLQKEFAAMRLTHIQIVGVANQLVSDVRVRDNTIKSLIAQKERDQTTIASLTRMLEDA